MRSADPPSGTVTFLFTDIEGSTRLLQALGDGYAEQLAAHRRLLRGAARAHAGREVDTQGDAFFFAFDRASDAAAAAIAAQQALASHPWPAGAPLRVRMGLHTGEPVHSGEGYVGLDVHLAARLCAAAHGGQVLLSETTRALLERAGATGAALRDLGPHRLKDLPTPERITQLLVPGLPADFPPPRTLGARPDVLPAPTTPFLGREREVAAVRALLLRDDARLVTLVGPGGIGKTRLALQVAAELAGRFEHGVQPVELAALRDADLVASAVAQALRLREREGHSLADTLADYLHDRELLLLLDNFEHVLGATPLLATLLAACPRLTLLVTSQAVLRLPGEHEFAVPPLGLPDLARLPSTAQLAECAAVALFCQRAAAVQPDFALTDENAPLVAEICVRLDGLPLAIELAAARIKVLPLPALRARLERRLSLLTGGGPGLPARQQTLRAAIRWSYELLAPAEQALFRRLAVFQGGCTLEAAEAIGSLADGLALDALDGVASLVDKSLLRVAAPASAAPRLEMWETMREYGLELLTAASEADDVRREHARYFACLAESIAPRLSGADQALWLERLEAERANLRAALEWSLATADGTDLAARLAAALWRFWWARGYLGEGRQWLEAVLARGEQVPAPLRADVLHGMGNFALPRGDYERAIACYEEALSLRLTLADQPGSAMLLNNLAFLAQERGDYERATALHEEALALRRELGDRAGVALSLYNLGDIARDRGDYGQASALLEESLALRRASQNPRDVAASLQTLGDVARRQGYYDRATGLLEESLALQRGLGDRQASAATLASLAEVAKDQGERPRAAALAEESLALFRELGNTLGLATTSWLLGDLARQDADPTRATALLAESRDHFRQLGQRLGTALALHGLGLAALDQGDTAGARAALVESLTLRQALGDRRGMVECLEGLGVLAVASGQAAAAARLLGAAEATREALPAPLPPAERAAHLRRVTAIRRALGGPAFTTTWRAGRALPLAEAVAEALATAPPAPQSWGEQDQLRSRPALSQNWAGQERPERASNE